MAADHDQWADCVKTFTHFFKSLPIERQASFPVPGQHRESFFNGTLAVSDEVMALVLYALNIRTRDSIAAYFDVAHTARKKLPILTHDHKILIKDRQHTNIPHREAPAVDKTNYALTLPTYPIGHFVPSDAKSFRKFTRYYRMGDPMLHRLLWKHLHKLPLKDRAEFACILEQRPPLKASIVIMPALEQLWLEKRVIRRGIKQAPKGWVSTSYLRKRYTDSAITIRHALAKALKILRAQGFSYGDLQRKAYCQNRRYVPYYAPVVELAFQEHGLLVPLAERHEFPDIKTLKNYQTASHWRDAIGCGIKHLQELLTREAALRPNTEKVALPARTANGTVQVVYKNSFVQELIDSGHFKATSDYYATPERPQGWISSTQLSQRYASNKARMIRVLKAFQSAVSPEEAAQKVGVYRLNGKTGLFINQACLQDLEKMHRLVLRNPA